MIKRDLYLNKITSYIDKPFIKVLVGIRRAGKSTMLGQIEDILIARGASPEQIVHINFENLSYLSIRDKTAFIDLVDELINIRHKKYFLFDEIQNVEGWDEVINGMMAEYGVDIYVTGSNSKLLSRELSTHLTGRYVNIEVYPLNFAEYLTFRRAANADISNLKAEFKRFADRGGFPALHVNDLELSQCDDLTADIYTSIVFRDLIERHNIRNTELLARVVKFIFDNIGNPFSAKSITDYLKNEKRSLTPETIYNYLAWLEEAFVIKRISRYDLRGKEILSTNEKYYLGDIGLLYAINGRQNSYLSGVLENIVLNELLSRGYQVNIGKNQSAEIDFVATKKSTKIYLQVAASLAEKSTIDREYAAFAGIDDNHPKYILTLDQPFGENRDGIRCVNLPEFLLSLE